MTVIVTDAVIHGKSVLKWARARRTDVRIWCCQKRLRKLPPPVSSCQGVSMKGEDFGAARGSPRLADPWHASVSVTHWTLHSAFLLLPLTQCFSNLSLQQNRLKGLLKAQALPHPPSFWFSRFGVNPQHLHF